MTAEAHPARRLPGEEGVWVFVLGDMAVFALFFGAIVYTRGQDPAVFAEAQSHLSRTLGALNTLLLVTSSLLVALGVRSADGRRAGHAPALFGGALACAVGFAAVKVTEYAHLISAGHVPADDDPTMYYFIFTGVHLLHVAIGIAVLAWVIRLARRPARTARDGALLECGTSFWHMVDLLWVVLFPLLYLMS